MTRWGEIQCPSCEELEAKLRKSALQELSALGQASEAYQAQLAAEAKLAQMQRTLDCAEDRAKYYREGREMMGHKWAKAEDGREKAIEAMERAVALALEECPFQEGTPSYNDWWYNRRTTLAELKRQDDD